MRRTSPQPSQAFSGTAAQRHSAVSGSMRREPKGHTLRPLTMANTPDPDWRDCPVNAERRRSPWPYGTWLTHNQLVGDDGAMSDVYLHVGPVKTGFTYLTGGHRCRASPCGDRPDGQV